MDTKMSAKQSCHGCYSCGAVDGDSWETEPGRPIKLSIEIVATDTFDKHLEPYQLRAICNECKEGLEGLHNVSLPKADRIGLLSQVRRATIDDQRAVLEWLQQKFAERSKSK
jgi:hypothetical protein